MSNICACFLTNVLDFIKMEVKCKEDLLDGVKLQFNLSHVGCNKKRGGSRNKKREDIDLGEGEYQ